MKTLILLASALAALPAGATSADLSFDRPAVTVPTNDLDLSTPDGQSRLAKRIGVAVRQVCYEPGPPSTQRQQRMAECTASAGQFAHRDAERAVAAATFRPLDRFASAQLP
jgi:UrcA family protein